MKHRTISLYIMAVLLLLSSIASAQEKKHTTKATRTKVAPKQTTKSSKKSTTPKPENAQKDSPADELASKASKEENNEPEDTGDTGEIEDTENRATAIRSQMTLKVVNPDVARVEIKKTVSELGGYATRITDSFIVLKLPPQKMTAAIDAFVKQGILVEKTIEREDLTLEIAQLNGKLTSQKKILEKLRGFFNDADFSSTLEIERSMSRLVGEIEDVKGRLRYLFDQAQWSVVEVHFRFRERENVMYVSSPFQWLNSANLSTFMEEF